MKSSPVQLHNLQNSGFFFSQEETYLILLIYKAGTEGINIECLINIATCDLASFPHSLWGVVQSAENLTPRGLSNTFSTNDLGEEFLQNHQLDSFLLSKRRDDESGSHGGANRDPADIEEVKGGAGEDAKKVNGP